MKLWELDEMIRTVCPIDGLNSNGIVFFRPEATPEQLSMAMQLVAQKISGIEEM